MVMVVMACVCVYVRACGAALVAPDLWKHDAVHLPAMCGGDATADTTHAQVPHGQRPVRIGRDYNRGQKALGARLVQRHRAVRDRAAIRPREKTNKQTNKKTNKSL